jgi:hypothetical protein
VEFLPRIEWIPWEDSMSASGISDPVTPAAWAPAHPEATQTPQSVGQAQVEHRRREANSGEPPKAASSNPPKPHKVDVSV